MTDPTPVIFLSGGGGNDGRLMAALELDNRFRVIRFPGWTHHVSHAFSADTLIGEISGYIAAHVPEGDIRIIGYSLGAHLGYAAALRLQSSGRKVAGFCAIDGAMRSYALKQGLELLRDRQLGALCQLAQSKLRNSLIRFRNVGASGLSAGDSQPTRGPTFVLWLAAARSWTMSLDSEPVPLNAAAALIRTRPTAGDDEVWKRRCPGIRVLGISGTHHTLLHPKNLRSMRSAVADATREW